MTIGDQILGAIQERRTDDLRKIFSHLSKQHGLADGSGSTIAQGLNKLFKPTEIEAFYRAARDQNPMIKTLLYYFDPEIKQFYQNQTGFLEYEHDFQESARLHSRLRAFLNSMSSILPTDSAAFTPFHALSHPFKRALQDFFYKFEDVISPFFRTSTPDLKALHQAAQAGNMRNAQTYYQDVFPLPTVNDEIVRHNVFLWAAQHGYTKLLEPLDIKQEKDDLSWFLWREAVEYGHSNVIELLNNKLRSLGSESYTYASLNSYERLSLFLKSLWSSRFSQIRHELLEASLQSVQRNLPPQTLAEPSSKKSPLPLTLSKQSSLLRQSPTPSSAPKSSVK